MLSILFAFTVMLQEYIPYQYDATKIPECALTNQLYYNTTFCLQDDYYPVWVLVLVRPKVAQHKQKSVTLLPNWPLQHMVSITDWRDVSIMENCLI